MHRKILTLTAAAAVASLALSGCAAGQPSTLDYLEGTWLCTGGSAGAVNPGPFTARFDGETFMFEGDGTAKPGQLELPKTTFSVSERDGLTILDGDNVSLALEVPEVTPEDGLPFDVRANAAASNIEDGNHLTATIDGSSFQLTFEAASGGATLWDIGTCTKQ